MKPKHEMPDNTAQVVQSAIVQKQQGFFSKFLMGGTQNFQSPLVSDGGEVGWGGGELAKKIRLKPKLPT